MPSHDDVTADSRLRPSGTTSFVIPASRDLTMKELPVATMGSGRYGVLPAWAAAPGVPDHLMMAKSWWIRGNVRSISRPRVACCQSANQAKQYSSETNHHASK
ncbi:MAG: hypothetical protein NTW21_41620 [Verrucomicrobia bacterium]|nr:hypothetical protein [Verrucomicrobiota bacterium]